MEIGSTPQIKTVTPQQMQKTEKVQENQDKTAPEASSTEGAKPEGEVYTKGTKDTSSDPLSKQEKIKEGFEKVGDGAKKITGDFPEEQSSSSGGIDNAGGDTPDVPVKDDFSANFLAATETTAERETATDRNKQINIVGDTPEAHQKRVELLRSTPQINKTSGPDGENMCGGTALTSAMILDSGKTSPPDAAKKNADAIRAVYGDLCKDEQGKPKKLTEEQNTALKHLADGNVSPKDVEHLQKTLYEVTQKVQGQGEGGVNDQGMVEAVNQLRARGGFAGGSDVKFHLNKGEASRPGGRHWTTTVDGVHVDTWPTMYDRDKPYNNQGKSLVTGFPGASEPDNLQKGKKGWEADVSFSGDSPVNLEYMPPEGKKPPVSISFDKNAYDGKNAEEIKQKVNDDITVVLKTESTMERLQKLEKENKDQFDYEMMGASEEYKENYNKWKEKNKEGQEWVKNHPDLYE